MSRMRRLALTLIAFAMLGATSIAQAETIEIGDPTGPFNTAPFGTNGAYTGEYQQIYSRERFTSVFEIRQIAFASIGGGARTADYDLIVSLGTAASTPANPDASFDANKEADLTEVFSGSLGADLFGTGQFDLVINLTTPFTYDPSGGDLLLDVILNSATSSESGFISFVAGFSPEVGRVTIDGALGEYGLYTRFADEIVEPIPEPMTMILFGTGLAGVAARMRRRRSRSRNC